MLNIIVKVSKNAKLLLAKTQKSFHKTPKTSILDIRSLSEAYIRQNYAKDFHAPKNFEA